VVFCIAYFMLQFPDRVEAYSGLIFTLRAVLLELMTRNKLLSLIIILPFAMLIMGLRHLYWGLGIVPEDIEISVSFFLGITIGPIAFILFDLFIKQLLIIMPIFVY